MAVWLGPGHVQEFTAGVPNCMVLDSQDEALQEELITAFSSQLIRFYYGRDMIGNEIGGPRRMSSALPRACWTAWASPP